MADVFFTYAPQDRARAQRLAEALAAQGVDADWAREILPGQSSLIEMGRRIGAAKAVVAVWSQASIAAPMVLDEAGAARDQGKLVPVRIDAVESPLGFRQLQTADFAQWDGGADSPQLAALAQALRQLVGAGRPAPFLSTAAPGAVPRAKPAAAKSGFLRSREFWGWTGLLAALSGLLYFVSPLGREELGVDVAERIGNMIGSVIGAFLVIGFGRALLHLSRKLVGKPTQRFFDIDTLAVLGVAAAFAALSISDPEQRADAGEGALGLAHQFNFMMLGMFIIAAPLVWLVRGLLRLIRGAPKPA